MKKDSIFQVLAYNLALISKPRNFFKISIIVILSFFSIFLPPLIVILLSINKGFFDQYINSKTIDEYVENVSNLKLFPIIKKYLLLFLGYLIISAVFLTISLPVFLHLYKMEFLKVIFLPAALLVAFLIFYILAGALGYLFNSNCETETQFNCFLKGLISIFKFKEIFSISVPKMLGVAVIFYILNVELFQLSKYLYENIKFLYLLIWDIRTTIFILVNLSIAIGKLIIASIPKYVFLTVLFFYNLLFFIIIFSLNPFVSIFYIASKYRYDKEEF